MIANGKIIVIAYPDTFVTMSDEWQCKVLPLLGLGTKEYIKAGHAALILIENNTGKANYFDFGRYFTPNGKGRVRGFITDAELEIPFHANFNSKGDLINLNEFLIWLDENPQKTHGEGRLLASICDAINFEKAQDYILNLQQHGSMPYGAFIKEGSNCSRFVTETILAATKDVAIIKRLNHNKKFTPSAIGNVEKSSCSKVYEVYEGKVTIFEGSAFRENLKNYFHRKKDTPFIEKNLPSLPENAQQLTGIGSNAWFEISKEELHEKYYRIRRYNDLHEMDFDGIYITSSNFNISKPYEFTYDSHCGYCHIIQDNKKIKFTCFSSYTNFSLKQMEHSA